VFEKMSPNQRLVVAIVLSIIFFIGYTAVFPPEQVNMVNEQNGSKALEASANKDITNSTKQLSDKQIPQAKELAAKESNIIATIKAKDFILKLDTLGRIASKELLDERFRDSDDLHAQIIPPYGAKPLFIRFLDENLNQEAARTPYTASIKDATIKDKPIKVTLTQKLKNLVVTKDITFYADGHYDVHIKLSSAKRYFVYVGHRPEVSKKLMAAAGALVYTADNVAHIIEDGDVEARETFSDVLLVSAFDQYTASIFYNIGKDTTVIIDADSKQNPVAYFDAKQDMNFKGYLGPKEYKTLKAIDPVL